MIERVFVAIEMQGAGCAVGVTVRDGLPANCEFAAAPVGLRPSIKPRVGSKALDFPTKIRRSPVLRQFALQMPDNNHFA